MKEEQESFEGGHATSSIMRRGGGERLADNDGHREEKDRVPMITE